MSNFVRMYFWSTKTMNDNFSLSKQTFYLKKGLFWSTFKMKKMPEGSLMTLFFAYCNIILGSEQKNVGGVSVNERMCLKNAETLAHGMIGGGVGRGGEGGLLCMSQQLFLSLLPHSFTSSASARQSSYSQVRNLLPGVISVAAAREVKKAKKKRCSKFHRFSFKRPIMLKTTR